MKRLSDEQIAAQIRRKTAAMQGALQSTRVEAPAVEIGNLAGVAPLWEAGRAYEKGELFTHEGKVGYTRQALTSSDVYPPFSPGTEALYGVRPAADADGVYPYVYNMRAEVGMKVCETGAVYMCVQAADPLLYPPSSVPALFVLEGAK